MLNKQGKNKIDWTDFTWNPISGCIYDCPYCYMKRMNKRSPGLSNPRVNKDHIRKMDNVRRLKEGHKVFVGSSGDMWGDWVKWEDIAAVIAKCGVRKKQIFQFLTKNPFRYSDFHLKELKNCWFGTTYDGTYRTCGNISILKETVPVRIKRFISFEPLIKMPDIVRDDLSGINWIIIGANSNPGAKKPPFEWVDKLLFMARSTNTAVWIKNNYNYPLKIKEFPNV